MSRAAVLTRPQERSFAPEQAEQGTDRLFRLSVDRYHAMMEAGILKDGDPIELLEGLLVRKMTIHPPHAACVDTLSGVLRNMLPTGWYIRHQQPLATSDSEPEPDISVVQGTPSDYEDAHPNAADVALVIEVADQSLQRDRTTKRRIYARAGVRVYWIVNLIERQIEVCSDPTNGKGSRKPASYRSINVFTESQDISIIVERKIVGHVKVSSVLPRAR